MNERAKFNKIAPQIVVPDVVKTAEYYRDTLGFSILSYFLDPPVYAMVERDGVEIHFGKSDSGEIKTNEMVRKGLGIEVYIWVSDIEKLFEELKERNANVKDGIITRIYGSREIVIVDCNGFLICFGD